ncbi:MAG: hypothetical protein K9K79_10645 [Desulfohalobiaceae bacterium]|nr:hypothetical protein [Desulfohalobiaceae bacterium]
MESPIATFRPPGSGLVAFLFLFLFPFELQDAVAYRDVHVLGIHSRHLGCEHIGVVCLLHVHGGNKGHLFT